MKLIKENVMENELEELGEHFDGRGLTVEEVLLVTSSFLNIIKTQGTISQVFKELKDELEKEDSDESSEESNDFSLDSVKFNTKVIN
jgi:hypothetical protein